MQFNHCPKCKAKLAEATARHIDCGKCGFDFYINPVPGVDVVLVNERNEMLLTVRGRAPKKGFFDLPGGFIEPRESAEQAVVREIREELGIELETKKIIYFNSGFSTYLYKGTKYQTLGLAFFIRIQKSTVLSAADDIVGAQWFSFSKIPWSRLMSARIELVIREA